MYLYGNDKPFSSFQHWNLSISKKLQNYLFMVFIRLTIMNHAD